MTAHREPQLAEGDVVAEPRQSGRDDQPAQIASELTFRKPYLTAAEAAVYLSLPSVEALRRRIARGTIPAWCYTHAGRSLRFMRSALDEWLAPAEQRPALRVIKARGKRGPQQLPRVAVR